MWRNVVRVVGSSPSPSSAGAASNAVICRTCATTVKAPAASASISCTCTTTPSAAEVHPHSANKQQPSPGGVRQYWELDDWEFAGGDEEEKDHLVFGTLPSRSEVEEASSELHHALRLGLVTTALSSEVESPPPNTSSSSSTTFKGDEDEKQMITISCSEFQEMQQQQQVTVSAHGVESDWMEPVPLSSATISTATASSSHGKLQVGGSSAMLEAFHQFQHNPQVQGMVVSLATDKGVWDAVLANEKIQEFRRSLHMVDGVLYETTGDGIALDNNTFSDDDINIFAHFYWSTKKAFKQFVATLQELMSSLFDANDKKVFAEEEKDSDFIERTIKSCTMLAVVVLSIVVFKRSAAQSI